MLTIESDKLSQSDPCALLELVHLETTVRPYRLDDTLHETNDTSRDTQSPAQTGGFVRRSAHSWRQRVDESCSPDDAGRASRCHRGIYCLVVTGVATKQVHQVRHEPVLTECAREPGEDDVEEHQGRDE